MSRMISGAIPRVCDGPAICCVIIECAPRRDWILCHIASQIPRALFGRGAAYAIFNECIVVILIARIHNGFPCIYRSGRYIARTARTCIGRSAASDVSRAAVGIVNERVLVRVIYSCIRHVATFFIRGTRYRIANIAPRSLRPEILDGFICRNAAH